ncbi:MucR family transcriptional regulator, partial [Methylobacterium sp. A49B]
MIEASDEKAGALTALTAELVAAYVSNNSVPPAELPALIARVHGAIAGLVAGTLTVETGAA